ncbi:hypothetical protein VP01_3019g2 [Puccinia sorghi]|uniref:Aquaporin n=1 Tax=Puccinia sorghi TaxID=27349 RepID=A0A0L6V097_9BASI|nr:hypothetical protein VP01_3019g2 [Puccinia sorghi]
MIDRPGHNQPYSRSPSQSSSSGESIILNTPRALSPEEKMFNKEDEHGQLMSDFTPLKTPQLPEIGYELPYDNLEADHHRQIPPHRALAPTYDVPPSTVALKESHPGLVVRFKRATRVFWAEFFGTAILALFGTAVNNQVALSNSPLVSDSPAGTFLSVSFGWALAVMLGVFVSAGISGGHALVSVFPLNCDPSVGPRGTKCPPVYWLAQISGAVAGAGLPYTSNYLCFYNEILMTAILMIFVVAVGDEGNTSPPKNMGPFVIFWVVLGLASTLGMQTSFALNPARDLGPRIVTWLAGYGGEVWSIRSSGAIVGCFIYDFFIATEKVADCALHQSRDIGAIMKKFRDITPLKDPEQTNLTTFERRRPSRKEFIPARHLPTQADETSVIGSARTTSHRYTNITRG